MSCAKVVVSAFFGTLIYVFASIFLGPEGFDALTQLEQQKHQISMNLEKLQRVNNSLSYEFLALRSDPDILASCAKGLGYIKSDNERLVRLVGFPENKNFTVESGFAISLADVKTISEADCKILGLAFSLLSLVILQLGGFRKKKAADGSESKNQ